MVIFGATGDLGKRLVVPALYARTKLLPENFALIGVAGRWELSKTGGILTSIPRQ